jgi:hypothetical protein
LNLAQLRNRCRSELLNVVASSPLSVESFRLVGVMVPVVLVVLVPVCSTRPSLCGSWWMATKKRTACLSSDSERSCEPPVVSVMMRGTGRPFFASLLRLRFLCGSCSGGLGAHRADSYAVCCPSLTRPIEIKHAQQACESTKLVQRTIRKLIIPLVCCSSRAVLPEPSVPASMERPLGRRRYESSDMAVSHMADVRRDLRAVRVN